MAIGEGPDLQATLLEPVLRSRVAAEVALVLGVSRSQAEKIADAFDEFVAQPLRTNLERLTGRALAKRNPMIYTARGVSDVESWVQRVLADKETSAIEGHLGTWQEEVARIVSGGVKPASGIDLQIERDDGDVSLYALQAAPNTKNSGSRKADIDALKRYAAPLRAARRHVDLNVAVLHGRPRSNDLESEPGVRMVGSDDFWYSVSGIEDFRSRLLQATTVLADLMHERSAREIARIHAEAIALYDRGQGTLDMEALANPPPAQRIAQTTQLELFPKD